MEEFVGEIRRQMPRIPAVDFGTELGIISLARKGRDIDNICESSGCTIQQVIATIYKHFMTNWKWSTPPQCNSYVTVSDSDSDHDDPQAPVVSTSTVSASV